MSEATSTPNQVTNELREQLAALAHEQWSGWMRHLFSKCYVGAGDAAIPAVWVTRWHRQMNTPYAQLREDERDSDRKEADRILAAIRAHSALAVLCEIVEAAAGAELSGDDAGYVAINDDLIAKAIDALNYATVRFVDADAAKHGDSRRG